MVAGIVIVLATIVAGYFFVRWQKARQARQAVIDRQVAQGDLTGVKLDIPQPPELDRKKQKLATTRQAWWKGAARKEAPTKRLVEELDDLPNIIDRLLKQNQHFNSAVWNYSRAYSNWDRARKAVNELPNPEAEGKHHEWYDTVIKLRLKSRQVARQYYEARESIQPTATPVAEKFRTLEDILRDAADYDLSGLSEETKLAVETAARLAEKMKPGSYHNYDGGPRIDAEPEEPTAEAEALCRQLEPLNRRILVLVRKCQRLQSMVAERTQSYEELKGKASPSLPTKPAEEEVSKLLGSVSDWAKNVLDREAELKTLLADLAACESDIRQALTEVGLINTQLGTYTRSILLYPEPKEPDWLRDRFRRTDTQPALLYPEPKEPEWHRDRFSGLNSQPAIVTQAIAIGSAEGDAAGNSAANPSGDAESNAAAKPNGETEGATAGTTTVAAPRRSWWWGENTSTGTFTAPGGFTTNGRPRWAEQDRRRGKGEVTTPKAFEQKAKWYVTDQAEVTVEATGCVQALAEHVAKAAKELHDKHAGFAARERPQFAPEDESKREAAQAAMRKLGFAIAQLIYATGKLDALKKEKDQPVPPPSLDITEGNTFIQAYSVMLAQYEAAKKRKAKRDEQMAALTKQQPDRVQQQAAACETLFSTLDDHDMLEEEELPAALAAITKAARALLGHCTFKERTSKRATARRAEWTRQRELEKARKAEEERIANAKAAALMRKESLWVEQLTKARIDNAAGEKKTAAEAEAAARRRFKKELKGSWRMGAKIQVVIGPPDKEKLLEFPSGTDLDRVLKTADFEFSAEPSSRRARPYTAWSNGRVMGGVAGKVLQKVKHKTFIELLPMKCFVGVFREPGNLRTLEILSPMIWVTDLLQAVAQLDVLEDRRPVQYQVLLKGKPIEPNTFVADGQMVELIPISNDGQEPDSEPVSAEPVQSVSAP